MFSAIDMPNLAANDIFIAENILIAITKSHSSNDDDASGDEVTGDEVAGDDAICPGATR